MDTDTPRPDRPLAAEDWLPAVYDELRRLARVQLAREHLTQTLDATSLVHEAYLRLVGEQKFENTGHFFAAAAEAMRRILIEKARTKGRRQRSADLHRTALSVRADSAPDDDLLALDEALTKFATEDPQAAELVKLCYFVGLSVEDAGRALGLSRASAYREWTYAKSWLGAALADG